MCSKEVFPDISVDILKASVPLTLIIPMLLPGAEAKAEIVKFTLS